MQSIVFIETTKKNGKPISVRLGDMFVMKSQFAATKSDTDVSNYIILSLLTVAITKRPSYIYFSMIGMDKLRYSMSRRTENGLVILDRGKEIELDEKYMIKATKALSGNKSSGIVGGLELYIRTIITSPSRIKTMDMHKLPTRLVDLSKWPLMSLRQWAIYHLGLRRNVPPTNDIFNKTDMINSMIKLSVSARRSDSSIDTLHHIPHSDLLGVTTGRIQVHSYLDNSPNGDRFGKVRGIPFINLKEDEIKFPRGLDECLEVRPYSDVSRRNINPYMIVCVNNKPEWVLLDGDIRPQGHMTWTFYDGHRLNMPMKVFDNDLLEWLMAAHDEEDVIEESVEEVAAGYKDPNVHTYDHSCINGSNREIYHVAGAAPVMPVVDIPILKTFDDQSIFKASKRYTWVDEPILHEEHKIKCACEEIEDPEEEV